MRKLKSILIVIKLVAYLCWDSCVPLYWRLLGGVSKERKSKHIRDHFKKDADLIGMSVNVHGLEDISIEEGRAVVFICNHVSMIDIPACYVALPDSYNMRMIAKRELSKVPIFGWGMNALNFIFINRKNREEASRSLQQAAKQLNEGYSILVFPEGTRSKTGDLQAFKKGGFRLAQQASAIIVPLCVIGTNEILPKGAGFLDLQHNKEVIVKVGEPLDAVNYESQQVDNLMSDTRQRIKLMLTER